MQTDSGSAAGQRRDASGHAKTGDRNRLDFARPLIELRLRHGNILSSETAVCLMTVE